MVAPIGMGRECHSLAKNLVCDHVLDSIPFASGESVKRPIVFADQWTR